MGWYNDKEREALEQWESDKEQFKKHTRWVIEATIQDSYERLSQIEFEEFIKKLVEEDDKKR